LATPLTPAGTQLGSSILPQEESFGEIAMPPLTKPAVDDPHHIPETFVTSVVDVGLISGSTVSVTLGMRRHARDRFPDQEIVVVNNRLVLTLDAAQNLVDAVTMMLGRARSPQTPTDQTGLS
jgi:hypothetical protein